MFRELSAPVTVQWEVTPWCNFACIHCYNHWRSSGDKKTRLEVVPEFYQTTVSEIINNGVFGVTITGGEPLGVFKTIYPFLKQLVEAGVSLSLNSNGSMLAPEIARVLRNKLGVSSILISLPSAEGGLNAHITQRKRSHERTSRGIRVAIENGIRPTVNMVVTKLNLGRIFETGAYAASLGVKSFAATKASPPPNCPDFTPYGLSLEEFRFMLWELLRVREQIGMSVDSLEFYPPCAFGDAESRTAFGSSRMCTAGKTTCIIGFDGQIRACPHASFSYGHIATGLGQAWNRMGEWRTNKWLPKECGGCSLKDLCGGGCKINALVYTGRIDAVDPYHDPSQTPTLIRKQTLTQATSEFFEVNPRLKGRSEAFGGILYVSQSRWAPVNGDLYELVVSRKGSFVTRKEVAQVLQISHGEAGRTLAHLCSKQIVRERG